MIIVAQSSYTGIEIGLHDGKTLIQSALLDKKDACARLIPTLNALLHKEGLLLADISHIVVNKGPAPFSSLRTVIATMNGISFASGIPLRGVSAFEALNHAYNPENTKNVSIVFRAYSKEYYYALYTPETEPSIGIAYLDNSQPITGADVVLIGHTDLFPHTHASLIIPTDYVSLEAVAAAGLYRIQNGAVSTNHITPLYIKTHF